MTAEVILMNKRAVALAADSASTVSVLGIDNSKIFNANNKLFMLSKRHPIGIMLYGDSELNGCPWETLIKMYRNKIGKKSFGAITDYKANFIEYIENTITSKEQNAINQSVSGIAIAGFGDNDIFPSCVDFNVEGTKNRKLMITNDNFTKIDSEYTSNIKPYAQGEITSLFVEGINPHLKQFIGGQVEALFGALANSLNINIDGINELKKIFIHNISDFINNKLVSPVVSGIAILPPEDLSLMAETLINLTSFKRHISANETETVGGPTDVALITKGDGFIWMKRKHYFDAVKNHQFFSNYYQNEERI